MLDDYLKTKPQIPPTTSNFQKHVTNCVDSPYDAFQSNEIAPQFHQNPIPSPKRRSTVKPRPPPKPTNSSYTTTATYANENVATTKMNPTKVNFSEKVHRPKPPPPQRSGSNSNIIRSRSILKIEENLQNIEISPEISKTENFLPRPAPRKSRKGILKQPTQDFDRFSKGYSSCRGPPPPQIQNRIK